MVRVNGYAAFAVLTFAGVVATESCGGGSGGAGGSGTGGSGTTTSTSHTTTTTHDTGVGGGGSGTTTEETSGVGGGGSGTTTEETTTTTGVGGSSTTTDETTTTTTSETTTTTSGSTGTSCGPCMGSSVCCPNGTCSSETNTFACGPTCAICNSTTQVCTAGACVNVMCGAGLTNCSGACVNLKTDLNNCGACNVHVKQCINGTPCQLTPTAVAPSMVNSSVAPFQVANGTVFTSDGKGGISSFSDTKSSASVTPYFTASTLSGFSLSSFFATPTVTLLYGTQSAAMAPNNHAIYSMPNGGGAPTLASSGLPSAWAFTATASTAYVLSGPVGGTTTVYSTGLTGGSGGTMVGTFATPSQPQLTPVVTSSDMLLVGIPAGIWAAPLTGPGGALIPNVPAFTNSPLLTVQGTTAYFTSSGSNIVQSISETGSNLSTIFTSQNANPDITALASSASAMFVVDDESLTEVPLPLNSACDSDILPSTTLAFFSTQYVGVDPSQMLVVMTPRQISNNMYGTYTMPTK